MTIIINHDSKTRTLLSHINVIFRTDILLIRSIPNLSVQRSPYSLISFGDKTFLKPESIIR